MFATQEAVSACVAKDAARDAAKKQVARLPCPEAGCTKSYTTKFNLQTHINSFHKQVKRFRCAVEGCGMEYAYKTNLKQHMAKGHDHMVRLPACCAGAASTGGRVSRPCRCAAAASPCACKAANAQHREV